MPTVIDQLIIEIGLDPAKFTSGQKAAIRQFQEAAEGAKKTGDQIEDSGKRSAEFLALLQAKLIGLGQIIATGKLTKDLINFGVQMTKQDAATGRFAYTLGTTTQAIDKWKNAGFIIGGSGEDVARSIQGLTEQFQQFAITGESSVIPYFRALNVNIADIKTGKMRDFEDIMRDLSNSVSKLEPAKAAAFLKNIGLDPTAIQLIIKGGDELERILRLSTKVGNLNAEQAAQSQKLVESWNNASVAATNYFRILVGFVQPALIKIFDLSAKLYENKTQSVPSTSIMGRILNKMFGEGTATGKKFSLTDSIRNTVDKKGAFLNNEEKEAFIRDEAKKRNIEADQAMRVSKSEGFYNFQSTVMQKDGKREPSFGAFQLYMGGGLGNKFQKQTGLDPSDPKNERETIKFALDEAKAGGWGPWHGWKGDKWAGLNPGAPAAAAASSAGNSTSTSTSDVKIGEINVHTQATDAAGIAKDIAPAIQRTSLSNQAQAGPQ